MQNHLLDIIVFSNIKIMYEVKKKSMHLNRMKEILLCCFYLKHLVDTAPGCGKLPKIRV